MSSWQRIKVMLLTFAAYMGAIIGVVALQMLLDYTGVVSLQAGVVPFIVLHLLVTFGGLFLVFRVLSFRPYKEAERAGYPVVGEVLAVRKTGWKTQSRRNGFFVSVGSRRPRRYEYALRVRLPTPQGQLEERMVYAFLTPEQAPNLRQQIELRVHPRRPDVVVMPGGELNT